MKRLLMLTIAATMLVTAVLRRAQQQKFDLSTITCKQFFEYSKDNMTMILMWLDGYYADEDAPPIVDFDKMDENSKKLGEYCAQESEQQHDHRRRRDDWATSASSRRPAFARQEGRLPAFARPRRGQRADQQQQAEQAGEHRQHADAAHHAGVAHLQADPVVAAVGVARPHRDDARQR